MIELDVLGDRQQVWPELEAAGVTTGFRGQDAVDLAASLWPSQPTELPDLHVSIRYPQPKLQPARVQRRGRPDSPELRLTPRRYGYLEIAPGLLAVKWRSHPTEPGSDEAHGVDCDCDHCRAFDEAGECPHCGASGGLCEDCAAEAPAARVITEFSHRAKLRMMQYIASVDWAAHRQDDELLLFLDLTYPDDWRVCAPTPRDAHAHLKAFIERFRRATGLPMRDVWVREFQEREAPHFHLLCLWPKTIKGELSRTWLSRTWYEVVGSGDVKHLRAGTRINYKEALRGAVDPKRAAAYFAGYCEKNKLYQHQAPEDWRNPNGSAGGFWGHHGLTKATAQVPVTEGDDIELRRLARRMIRAQKRTVPRRVARNIETVYVNSETGEVISEAELQDLDDVEQSRFVPMAKPGRYRTANRRWKLRSLAPNGPAADGMRGFTLFVNDGPLLAAQFARYLHSQPPPWPKGQARPLP